MRFCTVVNCMDGRVQLPVIRFLQQRFDVDYVDSITEPGPNLILYKQKDHGLLRSILARLEISIKNHGSVGIAVVGHAQCAGNPAGKDEQITHIRGAMRFLRQQYDGVEVIGIWVDENRQPHEISLKD